MSFQSTVKFYHGGNNYLTVQSNHTEHAHDMVLSTIYSLLALLDFSLQTFDDDVIDHLKMRVEELRCK